MWSFLFHSKITLERELAVERTKTFYLETINVELRERLDRAEREFARLRDASLVRAGAIHEPLRDAPAPPVNPLIGAISAMGRTSYTPSNHKSSSDAAMPDE
jgi:hypothetical protein